MVHAATRNNMEKQIRINEALRSWLALTKTDRLHLILDRDRQELRLAQGTAILRNCPVHKVVLTNEFKISQILTKHLRRYRPQDPWGKIQTGVFDWEQNLVEDAPETAALYFSDGLLLYAAAVWQQTDVSILRLQPGDLRALYNALEVGTPLVILPKNWDEAD